MPLTRVDGFRQKTSLPVNNGSDNNDLGNDNPRGGSRRRPSRKYKKSAKRVFRKKSRSTRRR
jgi:hypothetical protein